MVSIKSYALKPGKSYKETNFMGQVLEWPDRLGTVTNDFRARVEEELFNEIYTYHEEWPLRWGSYFDQLEGPGQHLIQSRSDLREFLPNARPDVRSQNNHRDLSISQILLIADVLVARDQNVVARLFGARNQISI